MQEQASGSDACPLLSSFVLWPSLDTDVAYLLLQHRVFHARQNLPELVSSGVVVMEAALLPVLVRTWAEVIGLDPKCWLASMRIRRACPVLSYRSGGAHASPHRQAYIR